MLNLLQARRNRYGWYGINRTTFQPKKKRQRKKRKKKGKKRKERKNEGIGTIAPEPKVYGHANNIKVAYKFEWPIRPILPMIVNIQEKKWYKFGSISFAVN